jgi:hypothetical protein
MWHLWLVTRNDWPKLIRPRIRVVPKYVRVGKSVLGRSGPFGFAGEPIALASIKDYSRGI